MTDEKRGFLAILKAWLPLVLSLVTAIGMLAGIFGREPAFAVAAVGATLLWLFLLYVRVTKRPTRHDPSKKHYEYSNGKRVGALIGLLALPTVAVVFIYFKYIWLPPLKCPPLTLTITKFTGDDDIDRRIRNALRSLLNGAAQGLEIKAKYRDFAVSDQGELRDSVNAAKEFGNSQEGHGNMVIWGQVASAHHPTKVYALMTIANKCDETKVYVPTLPQTTPNVQLDAFRVEFNFTEEANSQLDVEPQMVDFVRFVTGVMLYEEGQWEESANLLKDVRMRFGAFYEGLAWQELSRRADRIGNLKRASRAYERCVGPGWILQEEQPDSANIQHKAVAVGAYINASNALLDLSQLEPKNARAYLESAFSGYKQALKLHEELKDENLDPNWGTIARTNLAIAKIRLAAGDPDRKLEWLQDAERDFNTILDHLDENNPTDKQSWTVAKGNLGSLCLELSRIEQDRAERLDQAEANIRKALAALDSIHNCDRARQNDGLYDCAVLKSNLGAVFLERALDELSRDEALKYLAWAEKKYGEAKGLFSAGSSYSAEFGEEMSKEGLVLIERARWFGNAAGERLLENAVQHSSKALEYCGSNLHPIESALISNDLAYAKRELGKRRDDIQLLQESVDLCNASLSVLAFEDIYLRSYRAAAQRNLGDSLYAFGAVAGKMGRVNEAATAYRNATIAYRDALQVWTERNAYYDWTKTRRALDEAEAALVATGVQPGAN